MLKKYIIYIYSSRPPPPSNHSSHHHCRLSGGHYCFFQPLHIYTTGTNNTRLGSTHNDALLLALHRYKCPKLEPTILCQSQTYATSAVVVVPTTTVAGNAILKCLLCCSALLSKMNLPLGQRLHIVLLLTDDVDGRYIEVHPSGTDFARHLFLCSCLKKSIFVKEVHNIHLLLSTSTPFQPLLTPPLPFERWTLLFFFNLLHIHVYTTGTDNPRLGSIHNNALVHCTGTNAPNLGQPFCASLKPLQLLLLLLPLSKRTATCPTKFLRSARHGCPSAFLARLPTSHAPTQDRVSFS